MIKRIRCDQPSFRTVEFKPGFNVVLADQAQGSPYKESRNGLGKSTLVEIIQFCLGADLKGCPTLRSKELKGWTFILEISLRGKDFTIYRNTASPGKVQIEGDVEAWPIQPDRLLTSPEEEPRYALSIEDWKKVLGHLVFDLPIEKPHKFAPSFRSLISYFARKGSGAFDDPFKHYPQQKIWDVQVHNAFLLGLNWEYAAQFQEIKEKERALKELKRATQEGLLEDVFTRSLGELEAAKITLAQEIKEIEDTLARFEVHPSYREIEREANVLTEKLHKIANERVIAQQMLLQYKKSISSEVEEDIVFPWVQQMYAELGLIFPEQVSRRLEEVEEFHRQVLTNRRNFLMGEIERLEAQIHDLERQEQELSIARAKLMRILETHRALDEFVSLNERLSLLKQKYEAILHEVEQWKRLSEEIRKLKIQRLELVEKAQRDLEERAAIVERAITRFNANSEYLYSQPGLLAIDVNENGYRFQVEIPRSSSQGIGRMKVFCYDLMLIQIRAGLKDQPGFLIHDSVIFDGVDERQVARSLELAAQEAEAKGFQYICTLNSDTVPWHLFSEEMKEVFRQSIRLTLTDDSPQGSLLGIRF